MQFAPWVAFHPESFAYLEHCRAMLAGYYVAVEFRNATWFNSERHTSRTLAFERDNGFVNVVDEPQGAANSIAAVWEVTHPDLALMRLHGRNRGTWNKKGLKSSAQRFDYEYADDELRHLAVQIEGLSSRAASTHVLSNAAHLFFQSVSRRYERGSMLVTSNRAVSEWAPCSATASWPRRFSIACCTTVT